MSRWVRPGCQNCTQRVQVESLWTNFFGENVLSQSESVRENIFASCQKHFGRLVKAAYCVPIRWFSVKLLLFETYLTFFYHFCILSESSPVYCRASFSGVARTAFYKSKSTLCRKNSLLKTCLLNSFQTLLETVRKFVDNIPGKVVQTAIYESIGTIWWKQRTFFP